LKLNFISKCSALLLKIEDLTTNHSGVINKVQEDFFKVLH